MTDELPAGASRALQGMPATLAPAVRLWLERLDERQAGALAALEATSGVVANLLRLVAVSEFAGQWLLRDWPWFAGALAEQRFASPPVPESGELAAADDEAGFKSLLRRLRHRSLLHVLWRELDGSAGLAETLSSLSLLADRLIAASVEFARRQLVEAHGELLDARGRPVPLVVLAMGKLGGRELNFSSDVDLVFLYPGDGESDGRRPLVAQEYCGRQARRVVGLLEESTAEGFAYRVDTRLRPFGDSGPPVVSYAALESYLLNHGRGWERYAWLKSRIVTPAPDDPAVRHLGRELIEPFVYRRYLDYGVFESLREMKSLIAAEVERREMAQNLKLGPGGIREIEFIVQSLQLVRGGSVRGLRTAELAVALRQLAASGGLSPGDAASLRESYAFLRRLENFLQAIRDQQVHELPDSADDRARLALAMGYSDWEALFADTERRRAAVSEQFAAVAFRADGEGAGTELAAAIAARCEQEAGADGWSTLFAESGYADAESLAQQLAEFLQSRTTRQADSTATMRLRRLLPAMLIDLKDRPHPAETLKRLLTILGQILRRSAYVALLNENPAVLGRLVDLCEKSGYLADEIARFPLLLDEMFDPRQHAAELSAAVLRDDLAERLAQLGDSDSERRVEVLGQFQRAAMFRIAAADFAGEMPVMKVSDRLTDVAEIVLGEALDIAWRDLAARHGEPRFTEDGEARPAGLGVIAYGKLGGIELSYGSDLDLVFLHNSRGSGQHTNGTRELDNGMFFVRLARRLTHFLTAQTPSGLLYEVDTRLRPSGRAGLLVTSVDAFERYQRENAWTWEHQALLRARPVAGDAEVAREFERVRAATLIGLVNRDTLRDDVRDMRLKMRTQLDTSDAANFDLKQGEGGIGDIEFLVQYLVLQNAATHPAVIHYPDNIRQLGTLGAAGCLPRRDVADLQEIYRAFRLRLHQLLLDERPPLTPVTEFHAERARVRDLWEALLGPARPR